MPTENDATINALIIRTDRIGDVILTLPMAAAIKQKYPGARATMLVREYTQPVVAGHPDIDEVITIPREQDIAGIVPLLTQKRFTHVYCPSPSFAIARAVKQTGIPIRIGTAYRWYSSRFFTHLVRDHRQYAQFHEAEANLRMIDPTLQYTPVNFPARIIPGSAAVAAARAWLAANGIGHDEQFAIVHPGSGGSAKDLPVELFARIALRLRDELCYRVIFTGIAREAALLNIIREMTGIHSSAVDIPLETLIALAGLAQCVVANSTGVLHIAAATGTFAVGMYPPIRACSPKRWGPWTSFAAVFVPRVDDDCNGCEDKTCPFYYCMRLIPVEDVMRSITAFKNRATEQEVIA